MKLKPVLRRGHYAPIEPANLFASTRGTWLSHLYFRYLKKYRIVRVITPWLWRKLYLLYQLGWILRNALKLPLVPLSVYAKGSKNALSNAEIVTTPLPEVFPESNKKHLISPHSAYEFPEIYITQIHNAQVTGGTNLIMTDHEVIFHDLYDFSLDYTSEELNGRTYIWPYRQQIAWLMSTCPTVDLERAASFTDACANNYAHWMTEVLPRINLFCQTETQPNAPLIINAGLHRNMMESLRAVAGDKREIVALATGVGARVRNLSVTSAAGYVPFQRRSNRSANHSHGRFSPYALGLLRQRLQERCGVDSCPSIRRVFIKRNSGIRNIINSREIEELLVSFGFSVVEPELLTHAQQVSLFSKAEMIIGATGAAMSNIIFCKPNATIIIMIPIFRHTSYWYWQNISCAVGNKVVYVTGDTVKSGSTGIHSDFNVDLIELRNAIERYAQ